MMAGMGMPRCVTTSNSVKLLGYAPLSAFRPSPARPASRAGSSARARGSQQVLAACPFSASQREHLPFMGVKDGPFKMTMGVQPLDWKDWIEIDEWYEEEIELKRQMFAEKKERVLQEDPEASPASQELLQKLCAWLPSHYPDRFVYEDGRIHNRATGDCFDTRDPALDPLYAVSMLVQEDIALMYKGRLVGGGVCFPMRWSLMNYMGKDIPELHEKVPHFNDTIVGQVSGFLDKLKPERPFTRANWGIDPNPDLDQHPPQTDEEEQEAMRRAMSRGPITVENAGEKLFLRVERQTFSRLPESQAVVFTIHTFVRPLKEVRRILLLDV
ncbi:hypothetical protein DUNSADRAFT_1490 [Dunaliella salina]|uniref:Uncharacterized protein n=1 Tax=Dunaliella salina TaxID=3046 RepID=A0ABQ7FXE8_DUNSA|nr:hypothetical protein DUNSADRAFT_1490 [Dunaliella salina]|eukprot:KAF5827021.1 hypothetical protein DUNSADRAFT_1490 [Dunaliella salina]